MVSRLKAVATLALWPVLAQAAERRPSSANAPVVSPGQRIRVTAPLLSKGRITGAVIGEDAAAIWIDTGRGIVTVPRSGVNVVEVSDGRGSRTKGLIGGAASRYRTRASS